MNFGIWELVIILIIVALLFGTAKLRNIGGDLGSALKSFRSALKDDSDNTTADNSTSHTPDPKPSESEPSEQRDDSRQG